MARLIAPAGGTVVDPFAGTGSTGEACMLEGLNAALIEAEGEYYTDAVARMKPWL